MTLRQRLLAQIPDAPENFHPRAILLLSATQVLGNEQAFAAIDHGMKVVVVRGAIQASLFESLLPRDARGWSVLAQEPNPDFAPRGWRWQRALFLTKEEATSRGDRAPGGHELLTEAELRALPTDLREDLSPRFARNQIYVSRENGLPVAFSSVTLRTESFFDVGVDTLEPFRRRGHARHAARLVLAAEPRARRAHWGALESNLASLATAASLGFTTRYSLWAADP